MNADPAVQLRLLDVQTLDTTLDRLAHRRQTLPEHGQVDQLRARLAELDAAVVGAETEDRDLGREQAKLEGDVDTVRARMDRDRTRLDTGQVSSPRELENLQSEIGSLTRRQADLEDQVLEVMERREQVRARLDDCTVELEKTAAELAAVEERRTALLAQIDAEAAATGAERTAVAAELPAELLALYERIRPGSGGVGAAALAKGRCEGCHLQLNTVELNELRDAAPDAVLRCEECRRILVRTPASGL